MMMSEITVIIGLGLSMVQGRCLSGERCSRPSVNVKTTRATFHCCTH